MSLFPSIAKCVTEGEGEWSDRWRTEKDKGGVKMGGEGKGSLPVDFRHHRREVGRRGGNDAWMITPQPSLGRQVGGTSHFSSSPSPSLLLAPFPPCVSGEEVRDGSEVWPPNPPPLTHQSSTHPPFPNQTNFLFLLLPNPPDFTSFYGKATPV